MQKVAYTLAKEHTFSPGQFVEVELAEKTAGGVLCGASLEIMDWGLVLASGVYLGEGLPVFVNVGSLSPVTVRAGTRCLVGRTE